jgi:hypothetical protein
MSKSFYVPRADKDKVIWLNNFSGKFAVSAGSVGFTAEDVTSVNKDAEMFTYLMNLVETFNTAKEQRVNYKNLIKNGPLGSTLGNFPTMPVLAAVPSPVAPGIFPRIAQLVQRIKNHPNYTDALGKDLGIIGSEETVDTDVLKPVLKPVQKGGAVEVQWNKGSADGVRIETDKGAGWQFLAVDSVPHYTDTTPITTPGNWKYRAMYLISDELVGQWSDVVNITVG